MPDNCAEGHRQKLWTLFRRAWTQSDGPSYRKEVWSALEREMVEVILALEQKARADEKNLWSDLYMKQYEEQGFWQMSAAQQVWDMKTGEKYTFEGVLLGVGTNRHYIVRQHSSGLVRKWEETEPAKALAKSTTQNETATTKET